MTELISDTSINSELLLRSVIMYLKSELKTENDSEKKLNLKLCIEKLEIVLERLVSENNKSEKDVKERYEIKNCGSCLFYVRNHNKPGHIRGCKIKRDYFPQPENDACDKWRSKGR